MGAKLVAGRFFEDRDAEKAPKVVIVDERLARRFWPAQNPIGRRMYLPSDIDHLTEVSDKTVFMTVVGIVGDMKAMDLAEKPPVGTYFFPLAQDASRSVTFALKTSGDPSALANTVRQTIKALDPELPVFDMQTMEERTDQSLMNRRSPVLLSLGFGAVALFLSAIGIYGVLAYLVTQRTKEIGIRIALGSSARAVFELVLREGALLMAGGLLLGAVGAYVVRKSLESQLYGVSPADPLVLGTVTLALALVALIACAVPAWRATRIDPIIALTE